MQGTYALHAISVWDQRQVENNGLVSASLLQYACNFHRAKHFILQNNHFDELLSEVAHTFLPKNVIFSFAVRLRSYLRLMGKRFQKWSIFHSSHAKEVLTDAADAEALSAHARHGSSLLGALQSAHAGAAGAVGRRAQLVGQPHHRQRREEVIWGSTRRFMRRIKRVLDGEQREVRRGREERYCESLILCW